MILNCGIPDKYIPLLNLKENEEIIYSAPYDIAEDGSRLTDAFFAASKTCFYVMEKGALKAKYDFSTLETIKSEPEISCGILYIVPKGEKEQLVLRFSSKHLARYAYIAKGCRLLMEGSSKRVVSEEYEKMCPRCGRAIPGTRNCPRCSKQKVGLLHDMWLMMAPHKLKLFVILLLMFSVSVVTLIIPEIQKKLVDDVLKKDGGALSVAAICLVLMFIANMAVAAINVAKSYACARLGYDISEDLRRKLYAKLQQLSLAYITDRKPGDLMNRVVRDTRRISDFMSNAFCNLFTVIVILIFTIGYMLFLDWKLTLVSFIFIPVTITVSVAFRKNVHKRFHMQHKKEDKINSNLRDVLQGMTVVKSYGKEEDETKRFHATADSYARTQRNNEAFWAVFFAGLNFMLSIGVYFITYFGGKDVLSSEKTVGELMQFISYAGMMYGYVGWLTNLPRHVMDMVTSVERISDVLKYEPDITDDDNAIDHHIEGDIEFKDVTFGYKSYEPVLEHVNLKVNKGEMIGLVGASGAGKSTMINLIMRLYDVDDGELLIDGINIRGIKSDNYHSQIGVVLQETFLFSGTILNNIRFARPEATIMEVIQAAKMANAHDFICKTPDGYNTYVGERGYNLSGGERQRIAIARAILNNPRLLILDEATASLDTESEYLIQTALDRLTEGRTTFAIAHRLSTLKNADRLVVIDAHGIAEVGTHNELMEKGGIYYGLVTAQLEMQNGSRD